MGTAPLMRRVSQQAKRTFKRRAPFWIQSRVLPNAIRTAKGEPRAVHGGGVPLLAMVCTWMEEDIIFAAVRNAFALGAEAVILLDNGSDDSTVAEAVAAGATHVLTFKTASFDEPFKYRLINDYIEQLSRQHGSDRIWWLMMDADEFVRAPGEGTLVEFLSQVDDRCRVVGARVLDHYPTPGVGIEDRADPLSAQPMCFEKLDHRCELWHNKHPVFLWSADTKRIIVEPGFHQLRCAFESIFEPPTSLILDHFPFRDETRCRDRLVRLAERGSTQSTIEMAADRHMRARLESLDAVYSGNYDEVIDYRTGRRGISLSHWRDVVEPARSPTP